jgi:hypothetical protein
MEHELISYNEYLTIYGIGKLVNESLHIDGNIRSFELPPPKGRGFLFPANIK